MSEPVTVSMKDPNNLIGKFAVLYRNDVNVPAKIIRVDVAAKRIVYELLGGVDKGKKMSSRYDESQTAVVYDWDNLNLALMIT